MQTEHHMAKVKVRIYRTLEKSSSPSDSMPRVLEQGDHKASEWARGTSLCAQGFSRHGTKVKHHKLNSTTLIVSETMFWNLAIEVVTDQVHEELSRACRYPLHSRIWEDTFKVSKSWSWGVARLGEMNHFQYVWASPQGHKHNHHASQEIPRTIVCKHTSMVLKTSLLLYPRMHIYIYAVGGESGHLRVVIWSPRRFPLQNQAF